MDRLQIEILFPMTPSSLAAETITGMAVRERESPRTCKAVKIIT